MSECRPRAGFGRSAWQVAACVIAVFAACPERRIQAEAPQSVVEVAPLADSATRQDLLFLDDGQVLLVRVEIEVAGRPFREVWADSIRAVWTRTDADADGMLSGDEINSPGLAQADIEVPDGRISWDEYLRFTAATSGDAFQPPTSLGPGGMSAAGSSGEGALLFKALDRDHDGVLSGEDIEQGSPLLQAHDFDRDGAISVDELDHTRSPFAAAPQYGPGAPAVTVLAITPLRPTRPSLEALIKKYGTIGTKGPAHSIAVSVPGLPEAGSLQFDEDGDGRLDRREMRSWLRNPVPHVELTVRVAPDKEQPGVEIRSTTTTDRVEVKSGGPGIVCIVIGKRELEFGVNPRIPTLDSVTALFTEQWKRADIDANGYLDRGETKNFIVFDSSFDLFDRDADGKIFREELVEALEGRITAALGQTTMVAAERGADLFQILDVNRDRRLSSREVQAAVRRLRDWDANGDGRLGESEVPQLSQIFFNRGLPQLPGLTDPTGTTQPAQGSIANAPVPGWFIKMDRNSDGDVAKDEFPGSVELFERIDQDADGRIDADEAWRFLP